MADNIDIKSSSEDELFWLYFVDDKGKTLYYKLCEQSKNNRKQSFRVNEISFLKHKCE